MEQIVLIFGDRYTIKNKFHMHKKSIIIDKVNAFAKHFKDSKYMNLLVHHKELLKKCNEM